MRKEFFSSETMRSFYKTAKERGWVKKEEPQIVRTASAESLEPSHNLLLDLCRLADGLRSKGYIKQADDLEARIINYKTAETHLYNVHDEDGSDFLEFAHPEGDYKVEDAKDGNGVIKTLLHSHKTIVDVVNKEPTGKLGSLASLILKKAQTSPVETINNDVSSLITAIHADEIGKDGLSIYEYSINKLLRDFSQGNKAVIDYFSNKYPAVAQNIRAYAQKERSVYGDGSKNALTIQQKLQSLQTPEELIAFGRLIDPNTEKYDRYFQGSQPSLSKSIKGDGIVENWSQFAADNPESIWVFPTFLTGDTLDKDPKQLSALANLMDSDMKSHRDQAFAGLPGVNADVRRKIDGVVEGLKRFIKDPSVVKDMAAYAEFIKPISNYTTGNGYREITSLISGFGIPPVEYASASEKLNTDASAIISSETKSAEGQHQVTHTRFVKSKDLFNAAAAKSPGVKGFAENAIQSDKLASILSDNTNVNDMVRKMSEATGETFRSFADVDKFSIEWLTAARQLTGMSVPDQRTAERALTLDELPTARSV